MHHPRSRKRLAVVGACCGPARDHRADIDRREVSPPKRAGAVEPSRPFGPALVTVPAGSFWMGSNDPDAFPHDGEGPVRQVTVSEYRIAPTVVTNAEFSSFIRDTGYVTDAERFGWSFVFYQFVDGPARAAVLDAHVPGAPWWLAVRDADWRRPGGPGSMIDHRLDHPVVHVSWFDAAAFASWAGMRLPTEAEWERAARGGLEQTRFPWGAEFAPDGEARCNTWHGEFPHSNRAAHGFRGTAPVDAFEPNEFGLYNVAGNVWEWCADRFSPDWHVPETADTRTDPQGPEQGERRAMRGGSYLCHASYCNRYRVSARTGNTPDSSSGHLGFRCAA